MKISIVVCLTILLAVGKTVSAETSGSDFSVSEQKIEIQEGTSATLTGRADGAPKIYWVIKRGNIAQIVDEDKNTCTIKAGRVVSDTEFVVQFKAVFTNEIKVKETLVKIHDSIPEPVFYLKAPAVWDGRSAIEVVPEISNLAAMQAKGVGELRYCWAVSGGAVSQAQKNNTLILKQPEHNGRISVKLTLNNGGDDYSSTTTIRVNDPSKTPWVEPAKKGICFKPTVESLKQYETPEWFKDAKLGIYMHWGPQSIPGVDATWYARRMYEPGSDGFKYHVATYGHQSKFGYKDICKLFTAPKFDQAQADRLVELYKKVGARYVVPVAVHHDNFDMWDSKYQPRFNSVATAGKDIVGMWKSAADKHGLHLGVASHNARSYRWFQPSHGADRSGPMAGVPYDGQDPEYADLYGAKWTHSGSYPDFWYEQMSDVGPSEYEQNFENRMLDLINKYHPDLYYTDGGIPFHQVGLKILAHFYNENPKWNEGRQQAVASIKLDWVPNIAINNYEYGFPSDVQHYPWQTDKTMGACWYWLRDSTAKYQSAEWAIHLLVDAVSKNGNLLLNIPLTPEGELEPETVAMLTKMGQCLDIIGEAIFSTRCWVMAGDGHGNYRFTRNKENTVLYVINLGWSNDELRIGALGSSKIDLKTLESVKLLGSSEKLTYNQTDDELIIKTPKKPFESQAYAFKLTFTGQIPVCKK